MKEGAHPSQATWKTLLQRVKIPKYLLQTTNNLFFQAGQLKISTFFFFFWNKRQKPLFDGAPGWPFPENPPWAAPVTFPKHRAPRNPWGEELEWRWFLWKGPGSPQALPGDRALCHLLLSQFFWQIFFPPDPQKREKLRKTKVWGGRWNFSSSTALFTPKIFDSFFWSPPRIPGFWWVLRRKFGVH